MIGTVVTQLSTDLTDCKAIISDVSELEKMAKTFKSPWSFAYHVGKDLLVDGTDIYHLISGSVDAYDAADYSTFGKDVGEALALVLIGEDDHNLGMSAADVETLLVGLVEGALNQSVPSVTTCITDIGTTA